MVKMVKMVDAERAGAVETSVVPTGAPKARSGGTVFQQSAVKSLKQGPSAAPRLSRFRRQGGETATRASVGTAGVLRFEGVVPDLRTERKEMPTSPASDPSTGSGLLWTGTSAGRAPALAHADRLGRLNEVVAVAGPGHQAILQPRDVAQPVDQHDRANHQHGQHS